MIIRITAINILCFLCFMQVSHAQTPPTAPKSKLEKQIRTEKSNRIDAQKDIKRLQKELANQAQAIQRVESGLHEIENDIHDLEQKKQKYDERLQESQIALAKMISAALRMNRVPDMAILLTPDMPEQAAQSAYILEKLIPRIDAEKGKIATEIETLKSVEQSLKHKQKKAMDNKRTLEKKNIAMEKLLSVRRAQYKQSDKTIKAKEIELMRVSRKAQSLGELIRKADKVTPLRTASYSKPKSIKPSRSNLSGTFHSIAPLIGRVIKRYDTKDSMGGMHKGITIAGRDNALIVSPAIGTVKFTGAFKQYGNIVIIEHGNNFHSLIAGFEKIDTVVGQTVKSGEPIGRLKPVNNTHAGSLYFELRQNGNPVDPEPYIGQTG